MCVGQGLSGLCLDTGNNLRVGQNICILRRLEECLHWRSNLLFMVFPCKLLCSHHESCYHAASEVTLGWPSETTLSLAGSVFFISKSILVFLRVGSDYVAFYSCIQLYVMVLWYKLSTGELTWQLISVWPPAVISE